MNKSAKLPEIPEIKEETPKFEEKEETKKESSRTLWIIFFSFAILVCIGVLVWFVFSGRADQKIHGDNLASLTGKVEEKTEPKELVVTDKNIDLYDYDSSITLTEPGDYTLRGSLDYPVLIKSSGEVNLILSGVTISSPDSPSIENYSNETLTLSLEEEKINSLTSVSSKGDLVVRNVAEKNGRLISSALKSEGEIKINGGLVYLNGEKVSKTIDSKKGLEINGGTVIALSKEILESPLASSSQNSLTVSLKEAVKKGSNISIFSTSAHTARNLDDVETDFKSIIYSAESLTSGEYELRINGETLGTGTVE